MDKKSEIALQKRRNAASEAPTATALMKSAAAPAAAQRPQNLAKGFAADKMYEFNNLDHINTFNGHLNIAIPLGQIAAGPLALVIGPRAALLLGAGIVVLAVVGMLASRSVRTLVHHVPARQVEPAPDPVLA